MTNDGLGLFVTFLVAVFVIDFIVCLVGWLGLLIFGVW